MTLRTVDILSDLIAFPTISADPNRALVAYCADLLETAGARVVIIEDDTGKKANLFASLGPTVDGGVVLSGHTDVVPVSGQDWTHPPFELTCVDGRAYGRGTADMKGFVAAALHAMIRASDLCLQTPLHLALSYDEEIGCVGVRSMLAMLENAPFRPRFCIVGEPTRLGVATGHKGKTGFRVTCKGKEAHSALAPTGLNAIYLASEMIAAIRKVQEDVANSGPRDEAYDIDHTTLHVGTITGGTALNIVPNLTVFLAEIRNLAGDDPREILGRLRSAATQISGAHRADFPDTAVEIDVFNTYPPLETPVDSEVVSFVKSLTGANKTFKVAFGTEGGLFSDILGIPTVICGPGSMAQGHKPDEYIDLDQLDKCDAMLGSLLVHLERGL